jgi:hypothetical protein
MKGSDYRDTMAARADTNPRLIVLLFRFYKNQQ